MGEDRQTIFIIKWIKRGREADDPFDHFFSLWIALIVAAQKVRMQRGIRSEEIDSDREKILNYFRSKCLKIKPILDNNFQNMAKLARRRGTTHGNPIIDTGNRDLRRMFQLLSDYYIRKISISEKEMVGAFGELLNKIRNNLFHGVKVYDDSDDMELVNTVNPIFLEILEKCELEQVNEIS